MFPTFISILDIQSWWEVPSIAHFCSLFRTAFNLLDFDIEDLEEALLTDGTEETSWLQELIVRLLSGCLPNNEISTFNYQMFLRRLFRQKCQEHDQYNPFNTDVDFQLLPLRTKVDILHSLCDFRLDADDVLDQLKNLEADSLRVEPLGYDSNESAYWYFYGTRLYREDFKNKANKKKSVWQVICFTEEDWFQLNKKFKKSTSKRERQLYRTLTENFLPELPRLFREKERLARKRLLENQPRRTSRRLRKVENVVDKESEPHFEDEPKRRPEVVKKEVYEPRNKIREESEDSERSENRYEMAGAKSRQKKSKGRQRKLSNSSSNSKDGTPSSRSAKRKKPNDEVSKSSTSSTPTTVGRQTNNSLSAATGQIVIQPTSNPQKKKLKTSQVFRQTDEDLITGMHKILDYVKNHEDAWPFADPVDEEYAPNYYTVIRKPMDLQRMEDRLDSGYYKNFSKFRDDFQLIVDNCRLYNGAENEYTEMVDNLLRVFEVATDKFLDQISSSDDEIAVEFPKTDLDSKDTKKPRVESATKTSSSRRKPTLAAKTDKKRERSLSAESDQSVSDGSVVEDMSSKQKEKPAKKMPKVQSKSDVKKSAKDKKEVKSIKHKKDKVATPASSRSPSGSPFRRGHSSSPPPSSAPSSPDATLDLSSKKSKAPPAKDNDTKSKQKQKQEKGDADKEAKKSNDKVSKPVDKHNKLRETIEKLKAKSEISNKLIDFALDSPKENKEKPKKDEKKTKKEKPTKARKEVEKDDSNSTLSSLPSDKKTKKPTKLSSGVKNATIEALSIVTEQSLKDINKWLDDTPKFSEFSSASNSPLYSTVDEPFTDSNNKLDKKIEKFPVKRENLGKDIKRRPFVRDPAKFLKRREVQRTIDRLQPGKSKGNLISTVQNVKQSDELYPLGPLCKVKDSKNSLIVKTDDNAPKLSLGTVLNSFGKHEFVDDTKKTEEIDLKANSNDQNIDKEVKEETEVKAKVESEKKEPTIGEESSMMSTATPNLSAWFKAFGAPKVPSSQKKPDPKTDAKEEKLEDIVKKEEPPAKVLPPESSPSIDSPHGQPVPRQRKLSTGSSMSERSSFSQDMDSPRVGIDERLGAYPAPYPSPMHRSPSGASPVMASPQPDASPKAPYPPFNGQIRVGFYQDTVSNKSSPDKSCSPRDNPQSPYAQNPEHVYTPNTTQSVGYAYPSAPYYSHPGTYSSASPSASYNAETVNGAYYDTNKSLTDQYQAKTGLNYAAGSPANTAPSPQEEHKMNDKMTQNTMFPVKKRAYNETEPDLSRYEMEAAIARSEEPLKQYIPQNIPEPKQLSVQTNADVYAKPQSTLSPVQQAQVPHNLNYGAPANPYNNYSGETNYSLNIPSRQNVDRKLEKYTNMGYTGPDVNFARGMQQYVRPDLNYARTNGQQPCNAQQLQHEAEEALRYSNPNQHIGYNAVTSNPQQAHSNNYSNANSARLDVQSGPRPAFNPLEMEQPLGLRGNIANLSHIVDRYGNDERMLGLQQPPGQYYGDKGLPPGHIFNKPISTSAPGLPLFNQANMGMQSYNQNMQPTSSSMYNRQMTEVQNPNLVSEPKVVQAAHQPVEKKGKKRKTSKAAQPANVADSTTPANNQGFQSYAGLKTNPSMEPSAISLKTASVVPGSAFNFGPTPTGLGIGTGLYADKDGYSNFLEDFRNAPNYYIAAHRSTPEAVGEKQARAAHQASNPQAPSYPFIGAPPTRPPSYPLGSPFMPSAQAQLMDASYQYYLHSGVLNQGLLGPPGPYPPGYHPLTMRQPNDSMTRPPWL